MKILNKICQYSLFTILYSIAAYTSYLLFIYGPCRVYAHLLSGFPEGVEVVQCKSCFNDNFFHRGMYFILDHHNQDDLETFLEQINAGEYYDDYSIVENISDYDTCCGGAFEKHFHINIPIESLGKGYEIEKRRDDWLLIDKSGQKSYYIKN